MSSHPRPRPVKNNTSFWDGLRGRIHAKKGGWLIGEAVYNHGYSMLDELVGKASFFQVLVLNACGRLPERRLADWLEALFVCLSWPDSRIWCNQIGSLAGTLRTSPVAAVSVGILAADSRMYGPGAVLAGAEFIVNALRQKKKGVSAREIVATFPNPYPAKPPVIPGYVRPIASGDERVQAMEAVTVALDFGQGEYLRLACEIQEVMLEQFNEGMNLLGYAGAFLLDQGFQPYEMYRLQSILVSSGVHACYAEAADNPPESFFPLQCRDIDYHGPAARTVPERSSRPF